MKKSSFVFLVVMVVLILGGSLGYQYGTAREVTITVTDKERIVESDSDGNTDSYYLVFSEDDAYKNKDAFLYGKFKSSSLQAKLKEGQTYKVKIYGWRVGFLSMYPNIVKIVE